MNTLVDSNLSLKPNIDYCKDLANSCLEMVAEVVQKIYWSIAALHNLVVDPFTQGLADFFALETVKHGTSFGNYLNIRVYGADPDYGGGKGGARMGMYNVLDDPKSTVQAEEYCSDAKGYIHGIADSEVLSEKKDNMVVHWIKRQFYPSIYSGYSAGASIQGDSYFTKGLRYTVMTVSALFTPTLKFRFTPEEVKANFSFDNATSSGSIRTRMHISTENIGLIGIYNKALKGDVLQRMKSRPTKTLFGLIKILNPIGIILLLGLGVHQTLHAVARMLSKNTYPHQNLGVI